MNEYRETIDGPSAPSLRLFERLGQLHGYNWEVEQPFHSVCTYSPTEATCADLWHQTYDNWHVVGVQLLNPKETASTSASNRNSPRVGIRSQYRHHDSSISDGVSGATFSQAEAIDPVPVSVIARISTHILRLEREYQLCKSLIETSDPDCKHTLRPIQFVKLSAKQADESPLAVSIFESPGFNYMREIVDFGPAFWRKDPVQLEQYVEGTGFVGTLRNQIPLHTFLDFAIGASECIELLHNGPRVIHGEIRGDAFHFSHDGAAVRLVNFGSGPRSFENGLTSAGWSSLSREVGVKDKLRFIAPEQTGRMPAEPDCRTDIYSLGVLFWTILVGVPAVDGETPMDVVQGVLGRRIPPVASRRIDVPDALSNVITKMTKKQIDQRYHSTSGLKYDLNAIRKILEYGDEEGLKAFEIGNKDVSSFFVLPTESFGRKKERDKIVKIIDKVAKRILSNPRLVYRLGGKNAFGSTSSISESRPELFDGGDFASSDTSSQPRKKSRSNSEVLSAEPTFLKEAQNAHKGLQDTVERKSSAAGGNTLGRLSPDNIAESHIQAHQEDKTSGILNHQRINRRLHRKGMTEIISIVGAAGLGKSSLVQDVQGEIRKRGYFASAKFDNVCIGSRHV